MPSPAQRKFEGIREKLMSPLILVYIVFDM